MVARYWRQPRNLLLGYPPAEGLMELRRAVAMHLRANRGITCEPEQVFIFNGAQDAFNRIGNTLLDPGDTVWIENPGAIGARNSLIQSGADLVPVPVDEAGLIVEEGLRRAPDFRLFWLSEIGMPWLVVSTGASPCACWWVSPPWPCVVS